MPRYLKVETMGTEQEGGKGGSAVPSKVNRADLDQLKVRPIYMPNFTIVLITTCSELSVFPNISSILSAYRRSFLHRSPY